MVEGKREVRKEIGRVAKTETWIREGRLRKGKRARLRGTKKGKVKRRQKGGKRKR